MSAAQTGHSSPHRHRVGLIGLGFGLCGGPLAWMAQFNVNYALASHACFPDVAPRAWPLPGWEGIGGVILAVNVAALVVALTASAVSWRTWRATGDEHQSGSGHPLDLADGRSHFLAACGLMAGAGFFVATAANTAAVIWVPQCSG